MDGTNIHQGLPNIDLFCVGKCFYNVTEVQKNVTKFRKIGT